MCNAKPGPRCSYHTRKELKDHVMKLRHAVKNNADAETIARLKDSHDKAKEAWLRTPDGIAQLESHGKVELARVYENERMRQLASMKVDKASKSRHEETREKAAYHPVADCDVTLTRLSKDPSVKVRRAVVLHKDASESLMLEMAKDERPEVTSALATRYNQYPSVMHELAKNRNDYVRERVASSMFTSKETLKMLIHDSSPNVRAAAVASYTSMEHEEMVELSHDKRPQVRESFAKYGVDENLLHELAYDKATAVREKIPWNTHTKVETLEVLSYDKTPAVRIAVASSPRCPDSVLDRLALDEHKDVALTVAKRSNNPETLQKLCAHDDPKVRHAAKMNSHTPASGVKKVNQEESLVIKVPAKHVERFRARHPGANIQVA